MTVCLLLLIILARPGFTRHLDGRFRQLRFRKISSTGARRIRIEVPVFCYELVQTSSALWPFARKVVSS